MVSKLVLGISPVENQHLTAQKWAALITANLTQLDSSKLSNGAETFPTLDEEILTAPRRRSANSDDASLAHEIASILFPGFPPESLAPIIKYEETIVNLRRLINDKRKATISQAIENNARTQWSTRISRQGPWNEHEDHVSLRGAPSLPMPVQISDEVDLKPFFRHLRADAGGTPSSLEGAVDREEPYYGTQMTEFRKGALYEDGRLDLCKMVVGPPHIASLMDSLRSNNFVRHFLLGNNIIGPSGAKEIASFIRDYPNKMETWYLAGNCINESSFKSLVNSLITSKIVTNVWLKRNPLGPWSAHDVFRLVTQTPNLRTLDLDQAELGDAGVSTIFKELTAYAEVGPSQRIPLRNLYLNANGVGASAAAEISRYLATPNCALESIYPSNNPLGDAGISALASQLAHNASLRRLSLQSVGLKDTGAMALFNSLRGHPNLRSLDIGQSYATEDLGSRYNYVTPACVEALVSFISGTPNLEYLNLGHTAIPPTAVATPETFPVPGSLPVSGNPDDAVAHSVGGLARIFLAVANSPTLLHFSAKSIYPTTKGWAATKAGQCTARLEGRAKKRLAANVARRFDGMSYNRFQAEEKRWLMSPEDVRKIDSVYRNRDAGDARRGLKVLDKWWDGVEDEQALEVVKDSVIVS